MIRLMFATALTAFLATPIYADQGRNSDEKKHHDHVMGHGKMQAGTTFPADGETVYESPEHLMIRFGHAMTVERVTLTTLTGEVIDVDVSMLGESNHVMVNLPELQADDYTASWRAIGGDGHVMSGSFSFTVE